MQTRHSGEGTGPGAFGDDRVLLRACWEHESGAWEEFLARFGRLIYYSIHRTCQSKVRGLDTDEVDDIFNDVLVALIKDDCKKLRQYRGDDGATVATWIRTITVRFVIDYLRSQARMGDRVGIESEGLADEISAANPVRRPDEDFAESERLRIYHDAILSLPEHDRYFIELYYKNEKTPDEVAGILGISVKTFYTRVSRIKDKIRETISQNERK